MFSLIRKYPLAVLGALLVHVVFIGMLVLSFDWTARPVVAPPEIDIVKATIVMSERSPLNSLPCVSLNRKRSAPKTTAYKNWNHRQTLRAASVNKNN